MGVSGLPRNERSREMPTAKSSATESDTEPKHSSNSKTLAKPISLYPMSEEEAMRRLLRVPPPEKETKD